MHSRSRIGAVSLATALSFGTAAALADETPKPAQSDVVTQQNTAAINVEGMT